MRWLLAAGLLVASVVGVAPAAQSHQSGRVGHCRVFPRDDYWHASVAHLPVDPRSRAWLAHMSTSGRDLHPDFGGPYGIPVTTVTPAHPRVPVSFDYASESDRVGYPLGSDTRIEGGGDKHAVVVDTSTCRLYETYATRVVDGRWYAGSGATWSLRSNRLRPNTWTSADAAGLPILPGLLRWNEVRAGHVDHAIRFTTDLTAAAHLWPARHDAGSGSASVYPPMGARFRLRAGYRPTRSMGPDARVVVRAMKTYGLVLADNGSPWFFGGEQNAAWPDKLVEDLKTIPASAFVAVDTRKLEKRASSGAVR